MLRVLVVGVHRNLVVRLITSLELFYPVHCNFYHSIVAITDNWVIQSKFSKLNL